jgi:hypothetical protein
MLASKFLKISDSFQQLRVLFSFITDFGNQVFIIPLFLDFFLFIFLFFQIVFKFLNFLLQCINLSLMGYLCFFVKAVPLLSKLLRLF